MTMAEPDAVKPPYGKRRIGQAKAGDEYLLDRELVDLPTELRWREWMLRVEACDALIGTAKRERVRSCQPPAAATIS